MRNLIDTLLHKDVYLIDGRKYTSRLFHCFGNYKTVLNISTIIELLYKSGTQFLTVNTHNVRNLRNKDALVIGYTNITLDAISKVIDISKYTILNNTNLAKSSEEAISRAILASSLSGSNIIKLEVLNEEHTLPINEEVIKAAEVLVRRGYKVMPLIKPNVQDAIQLEAIGCSLVRVIGSPIESMRGIEDELTIKEICEKLSIPVIVDGGIGCPQDVIKAMKLGAIGVLVNKAIFISKNPMCAIETMKYATIIGRILYLRGQ